MSHYLSTLYTIEDGLPPSTILSICQTRDGYLWLASYEGIARFDGARFTILNKHNTPALGSNSAHVIFDDPHGYLWIGTAAGLIRYNGTTFTPYTTQDGLPGNVVRTLLRTREGTLWVGTSKGLADLHLDRGKFHEHSIRKKGIGIPVGCLAETDDGTLWVGSEGGGLHLFKDGEFTPYPYSDHLPSTSVFALFPDKDGCVWIGTSKGLLRHCPDSGPPRLFTATDGLVGDDVRGIHQDRHGVVWVITCDNGALNRYMDGSFTSLPIKSVAGICSLRSIFEDKEGNLWLGTGECGLCRLKQEKFKSHTTFNGRPLTNVRTVIQDRKGAHWFGTVGAGIVRRRNDKYKSFAQKEGIVDARIWSIALGRGDDLWVGTYGSGLYHFQGDPVHITRYSTENGLSHNVVRAIQADQQGDVWVGTNGTGIDVIRNGTFIKRYSSKNGLSDDYIFALAMDREGAIWAGTFNHGLNRIMNDTITVYSHQTVSNLPDTAMWAIYPDADGNIWIGTNDEGLICYRKNKFHIFKSGDGLGSDKTFQILEDPAGYLWLNNNHGVYKVAKTNLIGFAEGRQHHIHSVSYGNKEGIGNTGAIGPGQPVGWIDTDAKLWYPTHGGVTVIDTRNIPINTVPPPVILENIIIGHRDYSPSQPVLAPPGNGNMEIHYTANSFQHPERVYFKYRLLPFDGRWNEAQNRRVAYYTNIPPGEYVFQVIACNNDGIWNNEGARIAIRFMPPFWQTAWFKIFAVLALLSIGYGLIKLRTQRIEYQKRKLKELVAQQTRALKAARERAELAREASEAANQSKSEFLARMSHEIRTPMNSVIGFTEMLMDTELTPEQTDFVRSINQSGASLLLLINDILDFSKIEAGALTFETIDFDPEITAFDVCESILPKLEGKPIEVLCRIEPNVPAVVKGDPGRFRQVLTNLMANAVKFTQEGEIELLLTVAKKDKRNNRIKLHTMVRDTGIGIPKGKIGTIFKDFQQADGTITRKFGGTGLGLAICKQIARLMDGDVWADSTRGKGSTFHFTAWLQMSRKKFHSPPPSPILADKKVLVVDDNAKNLEILTLILKNAGIRVQTLQDSREAISVMQQATENGDPFDFAILDNHMPHIDGCQLAMRIRRYNSTIAKTPLLAFSSSISKNVEVFHRSGFNGYLPKPVKKHKLLDMAERLLNQSHNRKTTDQPTPMVTQHSLTQEAKHSIAILLAEDNPVNRKLADYMLGKAGYNLVMVENGVEAVEAYCAAPEAFDLIFMDIQMPIMDGKEAAQIIRQKGFTDVPIIAMTAQTMKGDREKCLEAGMNDYMAKPIKRDIVFKMVRKWCLNRTE